ncbi:MAG: hypothetical protein QMD43_05375 [Thermodesulfovibrio sp.]|uniref:hypothetical protein n=1 Tax=unclassified Thermodesulfovibrio TaxID=2645936 RepID=UPI00083A1F95|nr:MULTISPECIES: hypothetical protein [unclassified Thermodesulfovibrio]MDI1472522.1 hypothetical protein [Thermodesulfovibrio sp. 1176]MDI6714441.1 hypothetical protein [Thermodesulfovibrio sp.]ODA44856.1 hypothetical protein THER_0346 [Thermodesulfovibrio sp. N1]
MRSSKNFDELRSLLPLYLKGSLPEKKSKSLEKALSENEELKEDLKFWEAVKKGYQKIESQLPEHDYRIYHRISNNIKTQNSRNAKIWKFFSLHPKFSFAIIIIQTLIIISSVLYFLSIEKEFKTLSVSNIQAEDGVKINVVFHEDAKEKEIRKLINEINGRIIDGPNKKGLYVVSIKDKEKINYTLDILRKNKIVVFAELAY